MAGFKTDKLAIKMEELYLEGLPFYEAKKRLLRMGYKDSDITQALYVFGYKKRPKDELSERIRAHFMENPGKAFLIGELIMKDFQDQQEAKNKINKFTGFVSSSTLNPIVGLFSKLILRDVDNDWKSLIYICFVILSLVPTLVIVITHELPFYAIFAGPLVVWLYWQLLHISRH